MQGKIDLALRLPPQISKTNIFAAHDTANVQKKPGLSDTGNCNVM